MTKWNTLLLSLREAQRSGWAECWSNEYNEEYLLWHSAVAAAAVQCKRMELSCVFEAKLNKYARMKDARKSYINIVVAECMHCTTLAFCEVCLRPSGRASFQMVEYGFFFAWRASCERAHGKRVKIADSVKNRPHSIIVSNEKRLDSSARRYLFRPYSVRTSSTFFFFSFLLLRPLLQSSAEIFQPLQCLLWSKVQETVESIAHRQWALITERSKVHVCKTHAIKTTSYLFIMKWMIHVLCVPKHQHFVWSLDWNNTGVRIYLIA